MIFGIRVRDLISVWDPALRRGRGCRWASVGKSGQGHQEVKAGVRASVLMLFVGLRGFKGSWGSKGFSVVERELSG